MTTNSRLTALEKKISLTPEGDGPGVILYLPDNGRGDSPPPDEGYRPRAAARLIIYTPPLMLSTNEDHS